MKKRYLYALLFGIPGLFISVIISFVIFGAGLGVLWIFVLGDNAWPAQVEYVFGILFIFIFLIVWGGVITVGYRVGQKLEINPGINKQHILLSSGLTILLLALILFQQFSVGNLGPKSDSAVCSDFCLSKGYAGSGMPPQNSGDQTCSCYDNAGHEALKVPLDSISK